MNPLEKLWKDKMDIYRYADIVVNGITKSREELLYTDVKCHYSKGSLKGIANEGVPTLINNYIIFCSLETDLKEGDKVIVTQSNGRKVSLSVGEGFPYKRQQEFSVTRSETI